MCRRTSAFNLLSKQIITSTANTVEATEAQRYTGWRIFCRRSKQQRGARQQWFSATVLLALSRSLAKDFPGRAPPPLPPPQSLEWSTKRLPALVCCATRRERCVTCQYNNGILLPAVIRAFQSQNRCHRRRRVVEASSDAEL